MTCWAIADNLPNSSDPDYKTDDTLVLITDALGSPMVATVGAIGSLGPNGTEAMAIRPGAATPLYAWDPDEELVIIDPATGESLGAAPFQLSQEEVQGLTWANTADNDLTNDTLYAVSGDGELIGYNDSGEIVIPSVTVTIPLLFEAVDVAWDPSTGALYALLTDGGDNAGIIEVAQGAVAAPTVLDAEGLAFTPSGQMVASTGDDNDNSLYLIDKTTGVATLSTALSPATGVSDFESVDCLPLTF